jgi:outer membrane protein TolC
MNISARVVPALALMLGALPARADNPPAPGAPPPAPNAPNAPAARSAALDARIGALFTARAGLTADEVAARAAATSFEVQARHADLEAANAAVDEAIVGYVPRVTLTGRYLRLNSLPDANLGNLVAAPSAQLGPLKAGTPLVNVPFTLPTLPNNVILHANITVPVSDYVLRLSQAHAAASRSAKAAELNERAARLKAALDGRITYYSWARAKLQAFVTHQALDQSRDHLADVKHLFDAGSNSKADVLRVEAQVANSELLVQRAEGIARTSEEDIRIAMHDPDPTRTYALGEDLRVSPAPLDTPRDLAKLYAEALDRRPEIRALDETVWSLKEQGRVARALAYPRLDGLGQLSYDNPDPRIFPPTADFRGGFTLGAQITWTLNDIGNGVTSGKQVDAHRAQVEAQKGLLLDGLRNEVSEAEQAVEDAEVAIETGTRALAASEESYRVRRELFLNGRAISVELSDAETELTRASLDLVDARVELRVARARLLHAIGRDAIEIAPPRSAAPGG